ncbi:type IV pilus modification protein PilV [Alysiella filiformis]|uniref:Type IV pilus assembly protein PilV n=1 Tax=Alysiella filiformis DSM 16848 TaxID=1120981 RepID=A0A286EFR7_9NEIS|nr:type IV pilus modification protein PilV [Alysiella filiformis]QMT30484.1 type IV pilus modification protein PilV [Alysiella filiformis]UBQ56533.1 type IV pilus modification protein PilV [Alysiella filiformis DSM 16848]SOD69766.1 type IV pilus assembly protein PilV [Alysiella filiformis DSM 16848]
MKKMSPNRTKMLKKQSVKGATLIEVLVSVFLLTFGILGLMAAQLRSVSAVSESENHAIAAQAAENLAEAMQVNPDLDSTGKRSYKNYIQTGFKNVAKINTCVNRTKPTASSKDACALGSDSITKADLAKAQLGEFQYVLSQMPNTVQLKYTICLDDTTTLAQEAKNPSFTDAKCDNTGANVKPVIKVIWSSLNNQKETETGVPDTAGSEQLYYLVVSD